MKQLSRKRLKMVGLSCSFAAVAMLPLHLNHAAFKLEMLPSKRNTEMHFSSTLSGEIAVPLELDGSMGSHEVGEAMRSQFVDVCASKPNLVWSVNECANDLVIQLEAFVNRVCSYSPPSPLSSPSSGAVLPKLSASLHPNITTPKLSNADREHVLDYIASRRRHANPSTFKVIDVGGSAGGWSAGYIDALMDTNDPRPRFKQSYETLAGEQRVEVEHFFKANINLESDWAKVLSHTAKHGKFDFAICTHTLEDIAFPQVTLSMLGRIAHEGFIAVPSKYRELTHPEGTWLGYHHHRWIGSLRDGVFKLYPKLSFLEHYSEVTSAVGTLAQDLFDLSFFWSGQPPFQVVNGDYIGPTTSHAFELYQELLWDDSDLLRWGLLAPRAATDVAAAEAKEPSLHSSHPTAGSPKSDSEARPFDEEERPRHPGQLERIVLSDDATELIFAEGTLTL